jgi:hypothetical protein
MTYDVFTYQYGEECRTHRRYSYEAALQLIYTTRPPYVSVYANKKPIFKEERWEKALLLIVRHHMSHVCACGRTRCNCRLFR